MELPSTEEMLLDEAEDLQYRCGFDGYSMIVIHYLNHQINNVR